MLLHTTHLLHQQLPQQRHHQQLHPLPPLPTTAVVMCCSKRQTLLGLPTTNTVTPPQHPLVHDTTQPDNTLYTEVETIP